MELCHSCSSDLTLPWTDLLKARVSQGMETASQYFLPPGASEDLNKRSQESAPLCCSKEWGGRASGGQLLWSKWGGTRQGTVLPRMGQGSPRQGQQGRGSQAACSPPSTCTCQLSLHWSHFPLQSPACCDFQYSIPKPDCCGA